VLVANVSGLLSTFGLFGAFILIPNFVETPRGFPGELARVVDYGFGATPTTAGLYLLPGAVGGFLTGPLAPLLGRRFGDRVPLALGMIVAGGGMALLAAAHDHPWQIVAAMTVVGVGIPLSFAIMPKLIGDAVSQRETGVANGMNTVMRTIGGVIGGQVGATILASKTIGNSGVPAESAYATAFWIGAGGLGVAALVALLATGGKRVRTATLSR
jgi:cyanate permease